jgi:hypothetical protein
LLLFSCEKQPEARKVKHNVAAIQLKLNLYAIVLSNKEENQHPPHYAKPHHSDSVVPMTIIKNIGQIIRCFE